MGSSRQSFFGVTMGGEPGRQPSPSSSQRNPNHHHPIVPGAFGGSFANLYNIQMSRPVPVLSDDRSRTNRSGSGHPGDDLGSDDEGASQYGGGDGKGGSGPDLKKRKRNRQALSCSECKRRKIKCDRKIPCESCLKRGEGDKCHWEDPKKETPPQPFALAGDVIDLKRRLLKVELALSRLPPELVPDLDPSIRARAAAIADADGDEIDVPLPRSSSPMAMSRIDGGSVRLYRTDAQTTVYTKNELDSDTEEGALALEALAMGRRRETTDPLSRAAMGDKSLATQSVANLEGNPHGVIDPSLRDGGQNDVPEHRGGQSTTGDTPYSSVMAVPISSYTDQVYRANPFHHTEKQFQAVIDVLPPKETSDYLIEQYFEKVDWSWHVIHRVTFRAEYDAFWKIPRARITSVVDPLWIALYLAVLCLAVSGVDEETIAVIPGYSDEEKKTLPDLWVNASQEALRIGDWVGTPRIRTLQTILLYGPYQSHYMTGGADRFMVWLAAAIRVAQLLGLHRLGDDPTRMPPDDPSLPPGKSSLKRELCKRLWYFLCFLDRMNAQRSFGCYLVNPDQCDTNLPLNCNDEDLGMDVQIEAKPAYIATDMSLELVKYKMAEQQRKVFDKLYGKKAASYDTVLELDRGFREILEDIPDRLVLDQPAEEGDKISLLWTRGMIHQGVHNRLLRLHRPFMSKGYKDPRYVYSTNTCVKAAHTILKTHRMLMNSPSHKFYFVYMHVLAAVIVLFIDVFHAIDEDRPDSEIQSAEDELRDSLQLFNKGRNTSNKMVVGIANQGIFVVERFLEEIAQRRSQREARRSRGGRKRRNMGPDGGPLRAGEGEEEETFGKVVRRITTGVSTGSTGVSSPYSQATEDISSSSPRSERKDSFGFKPPEGGNGRTRPESSEDSTGRPGSGALGGNAAQANQAQSFSSDDAVNSLLQSVGLTANGPIFAQFPWSDIMPFEQQNQQLQQQTRAVQGNPQNFEMQAQPQGATSGGDGGGAFSNIRQLGQPIWGDGASGGNMLAADLAATGLLEGTAIEMNSNFLPGSATGASAGSSNAGQVGLGSGFIGDGALDWSQWFGGQAGGLW